MFVIGIGAPVELTPQTRLLVDAYLRACRALGFGRKQVADFNGVSEAQWARQIDGTDGQHVSLYRIANSPPHVIREWIKAIAPAYRLRALDREDDILRLINGVETLVEQSVTTDNEQRHA